MGENVEVTVKCSFAIRRLNGFSVAIVVKRKKLRHFVLDKHKKSCQVSLVHLAVIFIFVGPPSYKYFSQNAALLESIFLDTLHCIDAWVI